MDTYSNKNIGEKSSITYTSKSIDEDFIVPVNSGQGYYTVGNGRSYTVRYSGTTYEPVEVDNNAAAVFHQMVESARERETLSLEEKVERLTERLQEKKKKTETKIDEMVEQSFNYKEGDVFNFRRALVFKKQEEGILYFHPVEDEKQIIKLPMEAMRDLFPLVVKADSKVQVQPAQLLTIMNSTVNSYIKVTYYENGVDVSNETVRKIAAQMTHVSKKNTDDFIPLKNREEAMITFIKEQILNREPITKVVRVTGISNAGIAVSSTDTSGETTNSVIKFSRIIKVVHDGAEFIFPTF